MIYCVSRKKCYNIKQDIFYIFQISAQQKQGYNRSCRCEVMRFYFAEITAQAKAMNRSHKNSFQNTVIIAINIFNRSFSAHLCAVNIPTLSP